MPILFNFHMFLVTFYMIYWTNLLIQCQVPVSVFCMFFCITENPYQTKSKCNKILWRIILEYMWLKLESPQTEAQTGHKTPRCAPGARHMVVGCAHLVRRLELYFECKEAYIRKKNRVKISAQSELRISRNIRNGFRPDLENAKQKRTEREIQSRSGSLPSASMETMEQMGISPPI